MKYGIAVRNMGPQSTAATLAECARCAEETGFDGLFVADHLCIPPDQAEGSGGRYLDALATLAFLAAVTSRIRLGVSVLVLPYRPAVLTAKQVATIQELSGGRMILGVGVGWMKEEFEALGADYSKRGAAANDALEVIRHCFAGGEPRAFSGRMVSFPPFVFQPCPPRPPIWVGGNGPRAVARAIAYGDAWHPMAPKTGLARDIAEFKKAAETNGRDNLQIVIRRSIATEERSRIRAQVEADREAGVDYMIVNPGRYEDARGFRRLAAAFAGAVAA